MPPSLPATTDSYNRPLPVAPGISNPELADDVRFALFEKNSRFLSTLRPGGSPRSPPNSPPTPPSGMPMVSRVFNQKLRGVSDLQAKEAAAVADIASAATTTSLDQTPAQTPISSSGALEHTPEQTESGDGCMDEEWADGSVSSIIACESGYIDSDSNDAAMNNDNDTPPPPWSKIL